MRDTAANLLHTKMETIPVIFIVFSVLYINDIKTQPASISAFEDEAYVTTRTENLLGLSLEASSHHDELGLSMQLEESNQFGDELGLSLNFSSENSACTIIPKSHCENLINTEEHFDQCMRDTSLESIGYMEPENTDSFSTVENNLGTSITFRNSPDLSTPGKNKDELGSSFIESHLTLDSFRDMGVPLDKSTPFRKGEYGRLFAMTPARNIRDLVTARVGHGSTMRKKAMDLTDIRESLKNRCSCGRDCYKNVNVKSVNSERYLYWSRPVYLRMYWLIHTIRNSQNVGRHRYLNLENGQTVCLKAFLKILRINKNSYSVAKTLYKRKAFTKHGRKLRSESESTLNAISWLEEYANDYGDRMPNSDDIMLPQKSQKQAIYAKYKFEKTKHGLSFTSKSQFYKIWQKRFPHLKIRQTNPFSKCTTCFALERCEENELMPDAVGAIGCKRAEHHDRQMSERRYYYAKREKSKTNPEKFMSIIIDGMDQSKTSLPHFAGRLAKSINSGALLKTHITGVINHGHGGFHTYIDYNQYPHDPNLTINVILKALKRAAERHGNKLPSTLYVQVDNCWRENKNRYVLSFLQLLVEKNIFNEELKYFLYKHRGKLMSYVDTVKNVHLSFLYVGHTHEDVDQAFSVYSRHLKKTDIETLPDLLRHFENSEMLNHMFDIKSWLSPHIENFQHVSTPLHFKFTRSDKTIQIYYKGQFNSEWIDLESKFLRKVPSGKPKILDPQYDRINIDLNLKQIKNIKTFFKQTNSEEFWQSFYETLGKKVETSKSDWILDSLPRQSKRIEEDILVSLPDHVNALLQKETANPKVTLKNKREPKNGRPVKSRTVKEKRKKRNMKTSEKKREHSEDQPRYVVFRRDKMQLVSFDADVKKHIWILIFSDLLRHFFMLFVFLLFKRCLDELVSYLKYIWLSVLAEHLGLNMAMLLLCGLNRFNLNFSLKMMHILALLCCTRSELDGSLCVSIQQLS